MLSLACASHAAAQRKTSGANRAQAQSPSRRAREEARQPKPRAAEATSRARPRRPRPSPKPGARSRQPADKPAADKRADKGHAATAPSVGAVPDSPVPDSGEVRTEGDTQVKVMEFGGLDIEGQLKTPQMLYFLNRLRAEFGHPRLPHRSFMPELEQSTKGKAF